MGSNFVPQLRFLDFQGEWEEKRLGSLGKYIGGGTPSTSIKAYWEGKIPWISSSDVSDESIHKITKSRFITKKAIDESATKIIPKGTILMVSRVGVGKFAIADEELCTSQDFTNLVTNENEYFLGYYFKTRTKRFISMSQGTSIKGFTTKDIKSARFSIPSLPEQTKIATFLISIDKRITILKEKKNLLEQYKKGLVQNIFSQKIRFKDTNGNDFPEWEERYLGDVLKIGSGKDYKHLNTGNIPVYGSGGYMTSVDEYLYNGESIGIGRKGTIDKPIFLNGKFWTVDTLFFTHSFINAKPQFLFSVFQRINWKKYNEASGVPSLSKSTIEKIKINISSIPEQTKIASFLSSIDKAIDKLQLKIDNSELYKKGLLQKMFV